MTSPSVVLAHVVPPSGGKGTTGRSFRPDIEGLRAFAVLAVLVYHLNSAWLPGGFAGVDVFFVISGFLITSHLRGEIERRGSLSLARFYGRRITRLLPAATAVVVATAVATVVVVPRFVWSQFGRDTAYAGTYSLNWMLAARSVDYLAEDTLPSAVQHYWSLAVEEQFYLVWPVLLLGLVALARRRSWPLTRVLPVAAGVVVLVSFGYAVAEVAVGRPSAYFTSTTRLWELAVGAVVALTLPWVKSRLSPTHRTVLLVVGFGALLVSVAALTGSDWPAWPALVPVLGAGAVIVGGSGPTRLGTSRVLALPVLVWVGGLSYAIYLWHWPLITLARYRWDEFSLPQVALLAAATFGLAWGTQLLLENPIRYSGWFKARLWRPFALAGVCMVLSLAAGTALIVAGPGSSLTAPPGARAQGAAVLPARIDVVDHQPWSQGVEWVLPSPVDALQDAPVAYRDGCQQNTSSTEPLSCTYGDVQGDRTVALVGDSKALQWLPALDTWAKSRGYRLVTYVKSSCPLSDVDVDLGGAEYPSCRDWSARVTQRLIDLRPGLVVTSQVRQGASARLGDADATRALMVAGLRRTWQTLLDAGMPMAVIADTPQTGVNVYACVAERPDRLQGCEYDRGAAVGRSALLTQALAVRALGGSTVDASGTVTQRGRNRQLTLVDLTDAVCPDTARCPPVVGNALIYRSGSHLTKTYVDSLSARFGALLDQAS